MLMLLLLLLVLLGFMLRSMRRRRGMWTLYGLSLLVLLGSACGPVPKWLLRDLQAPYAVRPIPRWADRNAIIVLGVGTTRVPETGAVEPMIFAYGRIVEAYTLYRSCKQSGGDCKVIASGGDAFRNGVSEAGAYGPVLQSMGVPPGDLLLETHSMNTWQNAEFVQPLFKAYQPHYSVLVTSAVHLRRSTTFFAHFGMFPVPVRSDYADVHISWFPSAWNINLTEGALHEELGMLMYRLYNVMGWNAPPSPRGGSR